LAGELDLEGALVRELKDGGCWKGGVGGRSLLYPVCLQPGWKTIVKKEEQNPIEEVVHILGLRGGCVRLKAVGEAANLMCWWNPVFACAWILSAKRG